MWAKLLAFCAGLAIIPSPLEVAAQQYEGDEIPNSLPIIKGAERAFFRIKNPRYDPSDSSTGEEYYSLTNYASLRRDDTRYDPKDIQRAVIVVHGKHRDPDVYGANMLDALSQVEDHRNISPDNVAVVAPLFANGHDRHRAYPWKHRKPQSNALVWTATQWSAGANTHYPVNSSISAYEVLDQIVSYFDNSTLFPSLTHIVVSGHSLGAQAVQRYAALSTLQTERPMSYWVANPNSYIWFSKERPLPIEDCKHYDDYRAGYENFEKYPMTYGRELVHRGREAIYANYQSKTIAYGRATRDFGDKSSSCAARTSGENRGERFHNFIAAFPPTCTNATSDGQPHHDNFPPPECDTIDLVEAGHQAHKMMISEAGRQRLFVDNWHGDGRRAFDIGYPRVVPHGGDDPFPDHEAEKEAAKAHSHHVKIGTWMRREGSWWAYVLDLFRGA